MEDNNNYLYRRGTTPNTRVAVSQKNKVYSVPNGKSAFSQIGVMSSFGLSESRSPETVRGIGYGDQVAELVPGLTDPMTISVNRTLLYLSNIWQVFGYKGGVDGLVRSLKHHQWPFDIKHELIFSRIATPDATNTKLSSDGVNEALLTFYEACWMTSWGVSLDAGGSVLQEDVSITATDVIDGSSMYGELADTSTGNNPFEDDNSSIRFSNGKAAPRNLS